MKNEKKCNKNKFYLLGQKFIYYFKGRTTN